MATESVNNDSVFEVTVRGPNGEEDKVKVTGGDSAVLLRQRIIANPKFVVYTCFHLEAENRGDGEDLILDPYKPFNQIPVIGEGSTILVVPDLYDLGSVVNHIKHSISLLSNKVPLLNQLAMLNTSTIPESLKEWTEKLEGQKKEIEEQKEPTPIEITSRVLAAGKTSDEIFKTAASEIKSVEDSDLPEFMKLHETVCGEQSVAVKSLSLSSYNPPSVSRKSVGDLIYLRVVTAENNVFHITGNANGFFANKSTDSTFNPEEHADYPTLYPTLPSILSSLSSGFKQWYLRSRQNARYSSINTIVRSLPLLPSMTSSSKGWFAESATKDSVNLFEYADQMNESLPFPVLNIPESQNWLNDYNSIRDGFSDEEMKLPVMLIKEQTFAAAATRACKSIVDDGMPALFPSADNSACFIVDDIFISTVSNHSDIITPSDCNEAIASTRFINGAKIDGLYTSLATVVDYKGRRFLCQSSVPGIFTTSATNMIMWGSLDDGRSIYNDEKVRPVAEKLGEYFFWSKSNVYPQKVETPLPEESPAGFIPEAAASSQCHTDVNEAVEFLGPVEGRIVRGTDNRLYAADFLHTSPVDVYWKEEHAKLCNEEAHFSLRRNAVLQWILRREIQQTSIEEVKKYLEENKEITAEEREKMEKDLAKEEEDIKTKCSTFDPNAFTKYSKSGIASEEDVRKLGSLIRETILPGLYNTMKQNVSVYYDSTNLGRDLHGQGVNLRYLGKLAESCDDDAKELRELIEEEMIARSSKHILRDILDDEVLMSAPGFITTAFLNAIVCNEKKKEILLTGKSKKSKKVPSLISQVIIKKGYSVEKIWALLEEDIKKHFHYDLVCWKNLHMTVEQRYRLMRRVCQQSGIYLDSIHYDFNDDYTVRVENVLEFIPRVKYAFTPTLDEDITKIYQTILNSLNNSDFGNYYLLLKHLIYQVISAHSALHPALINILNVMLVCLINVRDFATAVDICRALVYTSEKVYGKDSFETAERYLQLADILLKNEMFNEAMIYNELAINVYSLVLGKDCEKVKECYLLKGVCMMQANRREEALKCMDVVLTSTDKSIDEVLNAAYYGCILSAAMKKSEQSAQYKKQLEELLEGKEEDFKKTMLENLQKQLKDLH